MLGKTTNDSSVRRHQALPLVSGQRVGKRRFVRGYGQVPERARLLVGAGAAVPAGHQGRAVSDQELFRLASKAKMDAVVPTSGFRVGAAAVTASGRIITGANLETSDRSGGGGTCAEGFVAFQLKGEKLDTILVTSDSDGCITPCGGCCQTLNEVAPPDARVVMTSAKGEMKVTTVGALLGGPEALADARALSPHAAAIEAAKKAFDKAEAGTGNVKPHGAVVVDTDGSVHSGATRKQSGAFSRAMTMAVDARFMNGSAAPVGTIVYAGKGEDDLGLPVPSGSDRQEMFNLGPKVPVILLDPTTGVAALTTPQELLPLAYQRN